MNITRRQLWEAGAVLTNDAKTEGMSADFSYKCRKIVREYRDLLATRDEMIANHSTDDDRTTIPTGTPEFEAFSKEWRDFLDSDEIIEFQFNKIPFKKLGRNVKFTPLDYDILESFIEEPNSDEE
jgi:hypothetical protein